MQNGFELPEPSAEALAHSLRVAERIRRRIGAAGGWIDFAEYMDMVLYEPGFGYYSAGAVKLGPEGDFVTAPEISPLFSRCLARACAPVLRARPESMILELGAGTGLLAAELLAALVRHGAQPARYQVLEVSADLRERQRATLARLVPEHLAIFEWIDALPAVPFTGIVLANEVVDALPVSRFTIQGGAVLAQGVAASDDGFSWAAAKPAPALAKAVAALRRVPGVAFGDGYTSEVSLRLPGWIDAIAAGLAEGLVLLCDYGMTRGEYYLPERRDGTLMCHYRHRAHGNPFLYPGLQDVTAWVDFTAAAAAADVAGLHVAGYTTQAHFLLDTGMEAELQQMMSADEHAHLRAVQQAKRLLLPGEMGERFKVMALTRGDVKPLGFSIRDLRHQL